MHVSLLWIEGRKSVLKARKKKKTKKKTTKQKQKIKQKINNSKNLVRTTHCKKKKKFINENL